MKYVKYILLCLMLATLSAGPVLAQNKELTKDVRRYMRRGNKLFHKGEHEKASTQYLMALKADSASTLVAYNMGTSLFPLELRDWKIDVKRDSLMKNCFNFAADQVAEQNPIRRATAFRNLGVMHQNNAGQYAKGDSMKTRELVEAIDAYKQSLRNNPNDDEVRYNLVVCLRQLPKNDNSQQNQQQNPQQDQEDKKDQEQPQQDQQKEQKEQQQQQEQKQQANPDKDWMEQMLNAAEQKERQTRRRLDEQQGQGQGERRRLEKNW